MILKSSFSAAIAMLALSAQTNLHVRGVSMEECKSTYLPALLECMDESTEECPYLPVPDSAFPTEPINELGYYLQHIRHTPETHVFAIGSGAVTSLIVVDVAFEASVSRGGGRRQLKATRHLKTEHDSDDAEARSSSSLRGAPGRQLQEFPVEDSKDMATPKTPAMMDGGAITIAVFDVPDSYLRIGEDGSVAGSFTIDAVGDILDMLNATVDDIAGVELIYTHGHMDHIGGANWTYNAMMDMGIDVTVMSTEGTLHMMEELIHAGMYSYRAPLAEYTIDEAVSYTLGSSTDMYMEPVNAHSRDKKDMFVFMGAMDDQPAIMSMIDIVFPKWSPFASFAVTTDLLTYILIHDKMLEYDLGEDGYLVGGHLTQLGNREDIELNKNLTLKIIENAKTALMEVNVPEVWAGTGGFDPSSINFGNSWVGFDAVINAWNNNCARATLAEFGCTFAGLDVHVASHCNTANSFVRIDS